MRQTWTRDRTPRWSIRTETVLSKTAQALRSMKGRGSNASYLVISAIMLAFVAHDAIHPVTSESRLPAAAERGQRTFSAALRAGWRNVARAERSADHEKPSCLPAQRRRRTRPRRCWPIPIRANSRLGTYHLSSNRSISRGSRYRRAIQADGIP